jgi:hypothetical protein
MTEAVFGPEEGSMEPHPLHCITKKDNRTDREKKRKNGIKIELKTYLKRIETRYFAQYQKAPLPSLTVEVQLNQLEKKWCMHPCNVKTARSYAWERLATQKKGKNRTTYKNNVLSLCFLIRQINSCFTH